MTASGGPVLVPPAAGPSLPRPASGVPSPAGGRRGRADVLPYLLVAPVVLFIIALAIFPAVLTVVQSFYRVDALDPPTRFGGLVNFRSLLADSAVRLSMANTALYVVVGVTLSTVLGIAIAVVLQRRFPGRGVVLAVVVLPWALPGVVNSILWRGIFDPSAGLLNSLATSLRLVDDYQVFIGEDRLRSIVLIELVHVWQITPLSALLVFAALQLVPDELYEAAELDGASPWAAFRLVTLPLVRPGVAVAMVQAVIATLNVFDQPYVLNGAADTAASVTMQTYFVSFQDLDFGEGYALSLVVTVTTLLLAALVVKVVYRRVDL